MEVRPTRRRPWSGALALLALWGVSLALAQAQVRDADPDLAATLTQAGARVEEFFTRAQSLVCTETVHDQPLTSALIADGFGRTIESELRLSWDAGSDGEAPGEARTRRQVLRVNGRMPRAKDHNNCTGPEQTESEPQPLSFLLASQRADFTFSAAGRGRIDQREALLVDFRENKPLTIEDVRLIEGNDDCIGYNISGGKRGRLWIDAETYDVLRLDHGLRGQVEIPLPRKFARRSGGERAWTIERNDVTMRFKRVTFAEPAEELVLPVSIVQLQVTRGATRKRTTTTFSAYKRFLTGGRLIPPGPAAR